MTPVFSRKSFLFLVLGVFVLLFGMAQSASAATCASYGDGVPTNPEWRGAGTITGCTIQYDDPVGGSNLTVCQYRILSNGGETIPWTNATGTCSGSSATLSINISIGSGLNCQNEGTDKCEVQYKVEDNAGNSATGTVVTLDIDYAPPSGGSISYSNGFTSSTSVILTVNDGIDAGSGINTATRAVQRRSAILSSGACGAYGSFATISPSGAYPSFTNSGLASDTCYQYRYSVSDNVGNPATYTSANEVKVDTKFPRLNAFSADRTILNIANPTVVISFSPPAPEDFGGSGILQVELWRKIPGGSWALRGTPDTPPLGTSFSDTPTDGDGIYEYGIHIVDNISHCITEGAKNCVTGLDPGDGITRTVFSPIQVQVDKTHVTTSLTSVAGDMSSPYWDRTNNANTDIVIAGEANMLCRWKMTDVGYSSMTSNCSISGSSATCSLGSLPQASGYGRYISCKDAAGNKQTATQNLDVVFGVDWTAPSDPGTTPSTTSPTNNTRPTWSWSAFTDSVSGVASYDVQWATNSAFTQNLGTGTSGTNSFTHSSALAQNTWYFKVKAKDAAGNEPGFSNYGTVVIDTTPPGTPNLISPSGTISTTTPTFNWNTISDPSGVTYTLWVDNNSNFGSLEINQSGLASSSYTPGGGILVDGTTYYWKVRAVDGAGNTGNFPAHNTFTVVLNQPSANPTSPLQFKNDGSTSISNQGFTNETIVKLRASATDADTSEVIRLFFEVALNSGSFASPATPTTGTSCVSGTTWGSCANKIWYISSSSGNYSSTPFTGTTSVAGLSTGTGYKWQVKACDDSNACSAWVGINPKPNFSVDTQPPTITTFTISPDSSVSPNWASNASPTITVTWNVSDQGGSHLDRVRAYRAPFDNTDPDGDGKRCDDANKQDCAWSQVGSDAVASPNADNWNCGATCPERIVDNPASGTWWYGIHVSDKAGNCTREDGSICTAVIASTNLKKALVDTVNPSTAVTNPTASTWFKDNFTATFDDSDPAGGSGLVAGASGCQYRFIGLNPSGTDISSGDLTRQCDPVTKTITVGASPDVCRFEGANRCRVETKAFDVAGNTSGWQTVSYGVDFTNPVVGSPSPNSAQSGVSTSYSATLQDPIGKITGCGFYWRTAGGGTWNTGAVPTVNPIPCENGANCTVSVSHTFASSGNYETQFGCTDQATNTGWGGVTTVQVESLSVDLNAVPTSGSVNTLFDFTADTAGSTMTGDTTYGFDCRIDTGDCTADGNFADCDFSITTSATAYTAADLCQYPVTAGTYTAKVATQRGVGTAQDTVAIGPITTNSDPTTTVRSVDTPNATDYCGVTGFPPVRVRWTFSDADPGDTQGAYELEVFRASDGVKVVDTGKKPGATQEYVFQSAGEQLLWGTSYTWQVKVWDNHDAASAFIAGPGFTTIAHYYPVPNFTWYPIFPSAEELIQFTDQTNFAAGATGKTWSWDFDNSNGIQVDSSLQNPTHTYSQTKAYGVTLQATDNVGSCSTSQTVNVAVPFPEWQEISPF